jgi:hypothetical protein
MAPNLSLNSYNMPASAILGQSSSGTISRVGFHAAILKANFGKLKVKSLSTSGEFEPPE